jgi:pimeloyl-ACP methyl ester carboxylesterase
MMCVAPRQQNHVTADRALAALLAIRLRFQLVQLQFELAALDDGVAWRSKPSAYVVAATDRTVNPELERSAAKRMGATTYDIESSHVPMLSHPEVVLEVIRNLVTAVHESPATA